MANLFTEYESSRNLILTLSKVRFLKSSLYNDGYPYLKILEIHRKNIRCVWLNSWGKYQDISPFYCSFNEMIKYFNDGSFKIVSKPRAITLKLFLKIRKSLKLTKSSLRY